jgi:hypothetical protein
MSDRIFILAVYNPYDIIQYKTVTILVALLVCRAWSNIVDMK